MNRPTTLQEYFNNAWTHAVVNRAMPAYVIGADNTVKCKYRTVDGKRCLIGVSIADEDYTPSIEGDGAHHALSLLGYYTPTNTISIILSSLQACHDQAVEEAVKSVAHRTFNPTVYFSNVEAKLRRFAKKQDLNIP